MNPSCWDGTETLCDNVFSELDTFQQVTNEDIIDTFTTKEGEDDKLSLAVIPKGMSFEYGSNRTANPGDVILADQQASDIYVYEYESPNTPRSLGVDVGRVSGVALLHQQIDETTDADLLLFTVKADNTLYIYNLTGSDDPSPITNDDLKNFFGGNDFFESPTALAVSTDGDQVVVFVLNDNGTDSSVRRLSVSLTTPLPDTNSLQTVATMGQSDARLTDIALFQETGTDTLFASKKLIEGFGGWVYDISNASVRETPVNLDTADFFIQQNPRVSGLAVAFNNSEATTAKLLLVNEDIGEGQVEQFDIDEGGETPETAYTPSAMFQSMQAIDYDCTKERLVMTDIPRNQVNTVRTFFQAIPTQ